MLWTSFRGDERLIHAISSISATGITMEVNMVRVKTGV